jgi:hypothetical protein
MIFSERSATPAFANLSRGQAFSGSCSEHDPEKLTPVFNELWQLIERAWRITPLERARVAERRRSESWSPGDHAAP